jgi:N-acetylmuramoyl-L-alanine amidase
MFKVDITLHTCHKYLTDNSNGVRTLKGIIIAIVLCVAAPATANANTTVINQLIQRVETNPNITKIVELKTLDATQRRQVYCLAFNIYHEARGSTSNDQWGVGFVTVNRHKIKNESICKVVWEQSRISVAPNGRGKTVGQFSWTTNKIDALVPREDDSWIRAQRKAYLLFVDRELVDVTAGATHFLDKRLVSRHSWARNAPKSHKTPIGVHMYIKLDEYISRHEKQQIASMK